LRFNLCGFAINQALANKKPAGKAE